MLAHSFRVLVGNGQTPQVEGFIEEIQVKVKNSWLRFPIYLPPSEATKIVMVASLLATLIPHITNYSKLTIQFYRACQFIILHGNMCNNPGCTSLNQLHHLYSTKDVHSCFTLTMTTASDKQVFFTLTYFVPLTSFDLLAVPLVSMLLSF